ncbi:hypothetical protein CGZ93_17645 [Enemella dayhoffiae]|uniref:Uridine kinase n=2 Tax=Enemella dayhoffiae TaxID=2016507 RepID=A0A255GLI5_9ACTN|nr:hypothetical protein CGZ93_17645 [Enemella dayhoffiae]
MLLPGLRDKRGRWVALLDGGSGAGKTSLAHGLATALAEASGRRLRVVSLDDCYPGWDGLAAGSAMVAEQILGPAGGYRRWDWTNDRPGAWVPLPPTDGLLVEGCGAITPQSVALADVAVWVELSEPVRRARALARDGAAYAPHWNRWAEQEARHWREHRPRELADVVLDLG